MNYYDRILESLCVSEYHQHTRVEKNGAAVRLFSTNAHSTMSFSPFRAESKLDVNLAPA